MYLVSEYNLKATNIYLLPGQDMVGLLVREAQVDLTRTDFSGTTAAQLADTGRSQAVRKILSKEMRKQL